MINLLENGARAQPGQIRGTRRPRILRHCDVSHHPFLAARRVLAVEPSKADFGVTLGFGELRFQRRICGLPLDSPSVRPGLSLVPHERRPLVPRNLLYWSLLMALSLTAHGQ